MSSKKKSPPPKSRAGSPKKNDMIIPQIDSAPKKEEKKEEASYIKKNENIKNENVPLIMKAVNSIKLSETENKIREINNKNKCALILDKTRSFSTLIRFKGYYADLYEYNVLLKNGKGNREFFVENCKKSLLKAIHNKKLFGILLDDQFINIMDFFKNEKFFFSQDFFLPSNLKNKDFLLKNNLMIEEEFKDFEKLEISQNNKNFQMCIVLHTYSEDWGEILNKVGFTKDYLEISVINW